jgi:hypothetical protein
LSFCLFLASPHAQASLTSNGGFEGAFTAWTVATEAGSGGGWYVQTGTSSPLNGFSVPAPPQGSYAAMTDSQGPSSQALLQTFTVPGPGTVTLSFEYFLLDATNGAYDSALGAPPDSLDYNYSPNNQQARVDILTASAGAFDLGGSVIDNVLTATPLSLGDPNSNACFPEFCAYQSVSVDISSYVGAGGTFQIRFAEVDDLGEPFVFGVDDVSIDSVPEPSSFALLGVALLVYSARTLWTNCTAIDPSPTAAATRFMLPDRTSPTANTPGRLVSSR